MAFAALFVFPLNNYVNAQVSVGPEVGFTAAGLYNDESDVYAGINVHAGATAHIQLGNFLAVRPSLLFKTGTLSYQDDSNSKISFTRISLPVPIMYSKIFDNGGNLFVGVGPNIMYSLGGKVKESGQSANIEFGKEQGQLKPIDIGLHLKGGFQFANGLALSTFFNGGFTNLSNVSGIKTKTMDAIGFSIGWMFGGGSDY